MIPIQATIVGYQNNPATVLAAYNEQTRVLAISYEKPYMAERIEGTIVITNDKHINLDSLFGDDHIDAAINAYFQLRDGMASDGVSKRLVVNERAMRCDPGVAIEKDGVDPSGRKFRVNETITCAQMAALAACWYAESRSNAVGNTLDMFDRLNEIMGIGEQQAKDLKEGKAITL